MKFSLHLLGYPANSPFFWKFLNDYQLVKAIKQGSAYADQLAFNDVSRYEKRKIYLSRGFLTRPRLF